MQRLITIFAVLALTFSLPTQYDLRVQSTVIKYADYGLYTEGICSGYSWAKELAQIVSNAVSLDQSERVALSAQHLLDCTETIDDKCYKATKQNILKAMELISRKGLTTNDCYLNRPFEYPSKICKRVCDDGDSFDFILKANFKRYSQPSQIFDLFKRSDKVVVFAIIKVDDSFNYYSPFNSKLDSAQLPNYFEYRVAEIVGWKNMQKKMTLRAGPGLFWGFEGYIDLDLSQYAAYIDSYYAVTLPSNLNIMSEMQ